MYLNILSAEPSLAEQDKSYLHDRHQARLDRCTQEQIRSPQLVFSYVCPVVV